MTTKFKNKRTVHFQSHEFSVNHPNHHCAIWYAIHVLNNFEWELHLRIPFKALPKCTTSEATALTVCNKTTGISGLWLESPTKNCFFFLSYLSYAMLNMKSYFLVLVFFFLIYSFKKENVTNDTAAYFYIFLHFFLISPSGVLNWYCCSFTILLSILNCIWPLQ